MGGLRGEKKWRSDRIGAPKAREIRRDRQEGSSRRSGRGAEGICPAHSGLGSLLSSQTSSLPSKFPSPCGCIGPGGIGGRPGRSGEASRRGPPGLEEQERRGGHLPNPFEPRKPAGLPGEFPHPLRTRVGNMPGLLLFLEHKPHPPTVPQGLFQPCGS